MSPAELSYYGMPVEDHSGEYSKYIRALDAWEREIESRFKSCNIEVPPKPRPPWEIGAAMQMIISRMELRKEAVIVHLTSQCRRVEPVTLSHKMLHAFGDSLEKNKKDSKRRECLDQLRVGDPVAWASDVHGKHTEHTGVVFAKISTGDTPRNVMAAKLRCSSERAMQGYLNHMTKQLDLSFDEIRYIVLSEAPGAKKGSLYLPKNSVLRYMEQTCPTCRAPLRGLPVGRCPRCNRECCSECFMDCCDVEVQE